MDASILGKLFKIGLYFQILWMISTVNSADLEQDGKNNCRQGKTEKLNVVGKVAIGFQQKCSTRAMERYHCDSKHDTTNRKAVHRPSFSFNYRFVMKKIGSRYQMKMKLCHFREYCE